MIEFDGYYFVAEEDIEAIIKGSSGMKSHPYRLTIRCKSGREYVLNYAGEVERDRIAKEFAQQVERSVRDRDRTMEAIFNRLYLMDDRLRRVDNRGLRIWRQLKALLGVELKDGGDERNG